MWEGYWLEDFEVSEGDGVFDASGKRVLGFRIILI